MCHFPDTVLFILCCPSILSGVVHSIKIPSPVNYLDNLRTLDIFTGYQAVYNQFIIL